MFKNIRDSIINFITSRFFVLILVFILMGSILVQRLFVLQIVNGEEYLNEFTMTIRKERTIASTRGQIFDRNGELLAYNELAYSVTIEDVYESGRGKNKRLNATLKTLIEMIEENGDNVVSDFNIIIGENGEFAFAVSGTAQQRFLADVYGKVYIDDMSYAQKTSTADDVINYLAGTSRFEVGEYEDPDNRETEFIVGKGYSKDMLLKIITIRYGMSLNSFQKYIPTVVAKDVSDKTVAVIMENSFRLDGVAIAEDAVRKYVDSVYFSHIIGYTGMISQTELQTLSETDDSYIMTDVVGKAGIENYMESYLQGTKGSEIVYVDSLGKIIETSDRVEPKAGNDLYLTIDKDLQKAVYNLLEQKIAGILVTKIKPVKEYIPDENASASSIIIPIDDVYYALINNSIIDINHFSQDDATELERQVYQSFLDKENQVFSELKYELNDNPQAYNTLPDEYQVYNSYITTLLNRDGIILTTEINVDDEVYLAWRNDESISLKEYLLHVIAMNWIDISKLNLDSQYSDSEKVYQAMLQYVFDRLKNDTDFHKRLYKYMIRDNQISGKQICLLLYDQGIISGTMAERATVENGTISPYDFILNKISNLEITPAQLALDPCSGSIVVTDVRTGEVLALVSYPGYDNNRMSNSEYYARLNSDLSRPLWDYATQQTSAPGSTYKMVVAAAALEEGVVGLGETVTCHGIWDTLPPFNPRCWIYPSAHGALNVVGGIENSCNYFFYEMGYRLGRVGGTYNSDVGLEKLANYADLFGLSEKSGVEIAEEEPKISDTDSVRSAIGQGTNNFTTVGLARYVTTVANGGTCYNLSLIDKVTDSNGTLIEDFTPTVRNTIAFSDSTWNAIHAGMRRVVQDKSYYQGLGVNVAGKTGTAQENRNRPNHALFVSYAPYENPEISVTTRIAFGYASDYAAELTRDVYKYYYHLEDEDVLINGTATDTNANVSNEE
ncbi:MAG: penicillin-binding protein [Lachnospiraceae bacterium]|nr:penicillin-binding protein [Lachnospiraceae bacterium]